MFSTSIQQKTMKNLLSFLVVLFFANIVTASNFSAPNPKNIFLKGTSLNIEISNSGNVLWKYQVPQSSKVSHAGLESSPCHQLAAKYLPKGAGAVFTFGLKGGYQAGVRLVETVRLFSHLANVGDTRSLIIHPASTTHGQLTAEQQVAAGAGPDVIRLSVGLETVEDLIRDLDQGLRG